MNRSLRLISNRMARKCFGLKPKALRQIPSLIIIPGKYSIGRKELTRRTRVFSVKQVEVLAVAQHGSLEAMENFVTLQNAGKLTSLGGCDVRWFTGRSVMDEPPNRYLGAACTEFPVLQPNNVLERGVWCLGCWANCANHSDKDTRDAEFRLRIWGELDSRDSLKCFSLKLKCRERSKSEFVEHVKGCKGAKDILRGIEPSVNGIKGLL